MFWTVPLSIIRSFSLYTLQWFMSYRFSDSLRAGSGWNCSQGVSKPVWHIPLLIVQWKSPDDGQRNCPKHVEFQSKNKFERSVCLLGFIIRNLTRCTVIWTSAKVSHISPYNASQPLVKFPYAYIVYDLPYSLLEFVLEWTYFIRFFMYWILLYFRSRTWNN